MHRRIIGLAHRRVIGVAHWRAISLAISLAISAAILAGGCGDDVAIDPAPGLDDTLEHGVRCGTLWDAPPPFDGEHGDGYFPLDIGVRIVVFESGDRYRVPAGDVKTQLSLLNDAFAGVAHFSLLSVDRINDRTCSTFKTESRCKRKARELHADDGRDVLWIYTASLGGLEGWATLPWSDAGENDGVVIPVDDVPGDAALHQVGHWLGIEACAVGFTDDELTRAETIFTTFRL